VTTLTTVSCYNCDSSEHQFYYRENGYEMVRCSGCGILYIPDRPANDAIANSTAIGQHHGEKTLHVDVYYNKDALRRNKKILGEIFDNGFGAVKSWLDVGCGHGEFIEAVQELSGGTISVSGLEPNLAKQKSAQSRGLDVSSFEIEEHGVEYDLVSLLNVYSHLPNPYAFIGQLKKLIKPGGDFLIQTGDAAEMTAEDIMKPLCLPDHISFVSEQILIDMLNRHGFDVVSVHKFPALLVTPVQFAKEVAKLFVPSKTSFLKYYLKYEKYSKANMYIRARRNS